MIRRYPRLMSNYTYIIIYYRGAYKYDTFLILLIVKELILQCYLIEQGTISKFSNIRLQDELYTSVLHSSDNQESLKPSVITPKADTRMIRHRGLIYNCIGIVTYYRRAYKQNKLLILQIVKDFTLHFYLTKQGIISRSSNLNDRSVQLLYGL